DQDFVTGAWDFARINRCYDDYLKILRALPANGSERARKNWIQTEWRAWSRAARADPFLPAALLPRGYCGREAWRARNEVLQLLRERD
ncbi:MAG: PaaX family transcriptional regulator C-terminal domain-containing protein, partial [Candidatus Acidiferrales bacterium]